ncbi:immunity 50 family protein [Salipaludibacillus sp. LMS25]|jgi:hypothetical protein|uniref:Imm50 family immunity protein n=1 Tax=Salipaludibacillus sp. LMS25 TaxID=2924031 RepID=UPI0020CFF327|nr:Imm50 family immunity protein [Salipaludibacillus sp. LMS25]UTR16387.1 immunity 50 family protein [Salipaludibacillus sp. LMS25]
MWYEVLERNHFLISLYDSVPELKNVRISELNIHDEGQVVAVLFDMPVYADNPPKKWNNIESNTVKVRIDFSAIQELSLTSSSLDYKGNIDIYRDESELITVKIDGTLKAHIKAESGFIQTISS